MFFREGNDISFCGPKLEVVSLSESVHYQEYSRCKYRFDITRAKFGAHDSVRSIRIQGIPDPTCANRKLSMPVIIVLVLLVVIRQVVTGGPAI